MPLIIREHPLTDSGARLNAYLFKGYMALPCLTSQGEGIARSRTA